MNCFVYVEKYLTVMFEDKLMFFLVTRLTVHASTYNIANIKGFECFNESKVIQTEWNKFWKLEVRVFYVKRKAVAQKLGGKLCLYVLLWQFQYVFPPKKYTWCISGLSVLCGLWLWPDYWDCTVLDVLPSTLYNVIQIL